MTGPTPCDGRRPLGSVVVQVQVHVRWATHVPALTRPSITATIGPPSSSGVVTGHLHHRGSNNVALTCVLKHPPAHGHLHLAASGTFTYRPGPLWISDGGGTDTFTVRTTHPHHRRWWWLSADVTLTMTLAPTGPPTTPPK